MGEQEKIIRLQKGLYAAYQRELKAAGVTGPPSLIKLKARLHRRLGKIKEPEIIPYADLQPALAEERLILIGDYHTLRRSQETTASFLETMGTNGTPPLVALECFTSTHDPLLRAWNKGTISSERLKTMTSFEPRWGFPWDGYRSLMEQANAHGIEFLGLEESPTPKGIKARDRLMAKRLAQLLKDNPDRPVVAVVGDLHLTQEALPTELATYGIKPARLFQNMEPLYWRLATQGAVPKDCVVKIDDNSFCILDAHPLLKVQSTLNWLDGLRFIEEEGPNEGLSARLNLLVTTIADWLHIPHDGLEPLIAHAADAFEFMEALLGQGCGRKTLAGVMDEIRSTGIYVHSQSGLIYLANPTVNQAAEAATIYLHSACSGIPETRTKQLDAYLTRMIRHALGWLGSQLINPYRQPLSPRRLAPLFEDRQPGRAARSALSLGTRTLHLLEQGKTGKTRLTRALTQVKEPVIDLAAKLLGERIGRAWFSALQEGKITRATLKAFFYMSLRGKDTAFSEAAAMVCGLEVTNDVQDALVKDYGQPLLRPAGGRGGDPDD